MLGSYPCESLNLVLRHGFSSFGGSACATFNPQTEQYFCPDGRVLTDGVTQLHDMMKCFRFHFHLRDDVLRGAELSRHVHQDRCRFRLLRQPAVGDVARIRQAVQFQHFLGVIYSFINGHWSLLLSKSTIVS